MPNAPSARPSGDRSRGWGWVLGALLVVLLVVVTLVLVVPPDRGDGPSVTAERPRTVSSPEDEPLLVREAAALTVPDTLRMESHAFEAQAGSTYLLEFAATATKPEDSPGAAMYFGASLACGGPEGGTLRSAGGTQNVRTGEQVTIRNQFLLEIEETGEHSCRLTLNSPNPEAAARGTTAEMTSKWSAIRLGEAAFEASADERLPRAVDPGERAAAFRYEVDLEDLPDHRLDLLSTLHLTTCTGTNGSWEDGRTWCAVEVVDLEGSAVEVTYRSDVLGADGEVCDSRLLSTTRTDIVRFTHHRVLQFEHRARQPLSDCGDTVRLVVAVENDGPAPVVIHRSNSTLLALSSP
jgi:hypothetical protein